MISVTELNIIVPFDLYVLIQNYLKASFSNDKKDQMSLIHDPEMGGMRERKEKNKGILVEEEEKKVQRRLFWIRTLGRLCID
jgi:hypothetical protein